MFHTAIFSESVDQATLNPLAALADPVMTISGDNMQVPTATPYLGFIAGVGANLTRAQLQSPSLRRILNYEVRPILVAATPGVNPIYNDIMGKPIELDAGEQLQGWASEDAAGASRMSLIVNLADKAVDPVTDPVYTVRATSAQTLVAYTWTNGALTLDQVLPVGQYAIVGARCESAGLLAFRFVLQNQTPRPGGMGVVNSQNNGPAAQRFGGWGVWGTFDNWTIPTVDFLSSSADTSEVLTIDLVKIG